VETEVNTESKFECSACGAARGCNCNAPARLRAVEAVKASPEKSNRAIAEEVGVDEKTVRKARESTADRSAVRTGLDGKVRKLPKHKLVVEPGDEIKVLTTLQTQPIIVNLSHPAETLARVIFETCGAAKADAVAKELNKLITAAGNDVPTNDSAEAMKAKLAAFNQQLPADGSIPAFLDRRVS
jgi:hypothetical protein